MLLIDDSIREILIDALTEDIGAGDVTTDATIPAGEPGKAVIIAKEDGVLCGTQVAVEVFKLIDHSTAVNVAHNDGERVGKGTTALSIEGSVASILRAERVALNFLGMLSGIATQTAKYADAVRHTKCKVTDTRKTTPLLRQLQKYAVRTGGGVNHRFGLYDMVLIKDNHVDASGGITQAVKRVRDRWGGEYKIEVETRTLDEVEEALKTGADRIMLDNMPPEQMKTAVERIAGKCEVEASGGITLETITAVAETGVDYVSVGALTHSFKCMDFSLQYKKM